MLLKVIAAVLLLAEDNGEAASGPFDWIPGFAKDNTEVSATPPSTLSSIFNIFGSEDSKRSEDDSLPGFLRILEDSAVDLFKKVFTDEDTEDKGLLLKNSASTREESSSVETTTLPPTTESSDDTTEETANPSEPPEVDEATVTLDNSTVSDLTVLDV